MKHISKFAAVALALVTCAGLAVAQDAPKEKAPAKAPAEPTLKAGDAAPALSIEKWVKGEPVTGFEKGRTYVVEFWATWCGPCIAQMPHLSQIQAAHKDDGLVVIGVTSKDPRNSLEDVEKMVAAKGDGMGYTVAWDKDRTTSEAYMKAAQQRGIPCSFVVDPAGKIAYIGHPMFLDLVLEDVMAGKWDATKGADKVTKAREAYRTAAQAAETPDGAKAIAQFEAEFPQLKGLTAEMKYFALLNAGDTKGAAAAGNALADQLIAHKDAAGLNELAWRIVDPKGTVTNKDADLALRAALEASKLTDDKDAATLDTLARCYWVKGDKEKAIAIQTKAVEHAKGSMKTELEAVLKEYTGG